MQQCCKLRLAQTDLRSQPLDRNRIDVKLARRSPLAAGDFFHLLHRCVEFFEKPRTAEALKPWYRFLCKRPLSNDDYFAVFNQPNVQLIDVSATKGVERLTEKAQRR